MLYAYGRVVFGLLSNSEFLLIYHSSSSFQRIETHLEASETTKENQPYSQVQNKYK